MCGDIFKVDSEEQKHCDVFLSVLSEIKECKIDGIKRYGARSYNNLGARGVFVDINRKYNRVRRFFWDDVDTITSENIEDTIKDGAIYFIHLLMAYREEQNESRL